MTNSNYSIFFGDYSTSPFSIEEFKDLIITDKEILRNKINQKISVKNFFLHQIHSINGMILNDESQAISLEQSGDFIITNLKYIAIGVFTADCLPIIFYDIINNVAAIAHAGWKGTVNNIAQITLENMKNQFESRVETTNVIFGPSAKACCYEVDSNFQKNIDPKFANKTLIKQKDKYFFDLPLYNKLVLEQCGIKNFDLEHNTCTICNTNFCSARREKENSRRQMTTIMLK